MRGKNGFIATSVLYSFLLAFLTLFLAYVANYLQNKLLLNRVENLAQEELDKYGNMSVYDMEVGDYAIFDTLDDITVNGSNTVAYSSPLNPNSRWILFKIEDETSNDEFVDYYFVSDINAQKDSFVTGCNLDDSGNCQSYFWGEYAHESALQNYKSVQSSLNVISGIINGNVFYNNNTYSYITLGDSDLSNEEKTRDYTRVYDYSFAFKDSSAGLSVNLLSDSDLTEIVGIINDNIRNAIIDQNYQYVFWDTSNSPGGFVIFDKTMFNNGNYEGYNNGADPDTVNTYCGSITGNYPATLTGTTMTYDQSTYSYGHITSNYVDYCYHATSFLGNCKADYSSYTTAVYWNTLSSGDKWSKCTQTTNGVSPRFVLKIVINKNNASKHVYADAGNGTKQYPYMITKGEKRDL